MEFFKEILDDGEVVTVIRLLGWRAIVTGDECYSVDGDLTVRDPAEGAFVSDAPKSCQYCYQEEWGGEAAEFTSSGASYINRTVNWT